jgi:hypothetical protein
VGSVRLLLQIKHFPYSTDSYTQRYPQNLWGSGQRDGALQEISARKVFLSKSRGCHGLFTLPHNFIHRSCAEAVRCRRAAGVPCACLFFRLIQFFLNNQGSYRLKGALRTILSTVFVQKEDQLAAQARKPAIHCLCLIFKLSCFSLIKQTLGGLRGALPTILSTVTVQKRRAPDAVLPVQCKLFVQVKKILDNQRLTLLNTSLPTILSTECVQNVAAAGRPAFA